jgi:uncharacterized ferritin-like protein (DUF455 family)
MNLYHNLEIAIQTPHIETKEKLTQHLFEYCSQNEFISNEFISSEDFEPLLFQSPSYASFCTIVDPKALKARKDFHTNEGLGTLIHAIAHIEYSAIDLALDAVYRFPDMPQEYKLDWLEVALDEIRHYKMLNALLSEIGYAHGDFAVHCGLFDASNHTAHDVLERMAIIPRYHEANGLDVNPQIVKKLHNRRKVPVVKKLIDALDIIYEEEINHVHKGDKWFSYLCEREKLNKNIYFDILEKHKLIGKHRPHFNVSARKEAGFSCDEIKKLAKIECE